MVNIDETDAFLSPNLSSDPNRTSNLKQYFIFKIKFYNDWDLTSFESNNKNIVRYLTNI